MKGSENIYVRVMDGDKECLGCLKKIEMGKIAFVGDLFESDSRDAEPLETRYYHFECGFELFPETAVELW